MTIIEHWLEGAERLPSKNMGGVLHPELVVIHYTATQSAAGVLRAFTDTTAATRVSAHLVIDRDGRVTQLVPFDRVAWHAGESGWKGKRGLNQSSIGIELVNPGYLTRVGDGFLDSFSHGYHGEVFHGVHASGQGGHTMWAAYGEQQLRAVERVCKSLVETYGVTELVGHDDISPGRKLDPGPAFPMAQLRAATFGT